MVVGDDRMTGFDLSGRVAVVTGGSRGLGREMAMGLARAGADVVVASRKQEVCQAVAAQIAAETGRRALGLGYHAGRWSDSDRLADAVYAAFGRCDVLVNNAGMSPLYPSLVDVGEELFDQVMGVNLKGPFRLSALIGTRMAEAGRKAIINVSSIAAVQPKPGELAYAAAKAGLNTMTVGLARAFAPHVRCNVIMPGAFLTDISKAWDAEDFARTAATEIPLRRGGDPTEVVGAALYLASDAAGYTTGAVLKLDGGWAFAPA